jgi:broad specificity phosphatase PhoE
MKQRRGRIVLVRHGETEANRLRRFASEDVCLTDLGRAQALELAKRLQNEFRPDHLVSSEFLRARQTGEIISQVLGMPVEAVPGIHELDFGSLKGQPYEELAQLRATDWSRNPEAPERNNPWTWRPPGGESAEDVRLRAIEAIERLRVSFPDREVVVVCHGIVIQAVCAHITGEWSDGSVPPNCGVVTVGHGPEGWETPIMEWWEALAPRQADGVRP